MCKGVHFYGNGDDYRKPEDPPPFPTYYPEEEKERMEEDIVHPDVFDFRSLSITFEENR